MLIHKHVHKSFSHVMRVPQMRWILSVLDSAYWLGKGEGGRGLEEGVLNGGVQKACHKPSPPNKNAVTDEV